MDFGLAKLLDTVTDAMVSTGAFGTVAYMAPEQYYGQVSMATDIYMLGVILYQMLAGKLPYEGNTNQVLAGHIQVAPGSLKDVPTLRSLPPHSVLALDQVILKAMAKAPPDRYQTCQTLNYAYYQAIKADPQRVAGNRVFDGGTLVSKKAEPPAPAAGDDAADDATVVRPAAPKKGLRKPARLCVTTEPHKGFSATFDLLGETLTLGRAEDNHLRVPLPIISRHHALLTRITDQREEPTYKITQCKSINSLRFHGNEVSEKILEHGDTIEVGKRGYAEYIVKFTYQAPEYST
ncbi:MAG: FHA domain-containing protein [Ktedonobacteraceae bacterium]|nr:FHA domain-containing protein [Ktedonobacteraceae bacterium]